MNTYNGQERRRGSGEYMPAILWRLKVAGEWALYAWIVVGWLIVVPLGIYLGVTGRLS